jgi:hypothetical protein
VDDPAPSEAPKELGIAKLPKQGWLSSTLHTDEAPRAPKVAVKAPKAKRKKHAKEG